MTNPDSFDDLPRLLVPRLPAGTWVLLALAAGAAPWVALVVLHVSQ